ncbi:MAG: PASTA domain-containing protein [Microbacterium gubbeenense]|uniref:PASTA domain-containing protein n=1 Tax=Microbacterium gubbeenense TaxID=159896 RepID=UPI003F9A9984
MTTEQQTPDPQQTTKKSIWKSKWLWIPVGVVVAIGAIGNLINPPDESTDAEAEAAIATVPVPDVTGLLAHQAQAELTDAGFTVTFDAGDDVVFNASNWAAVSTDPQAGTDTEEASAVIVVVERSEAWLAEEAAEHKADEEKAQKKADEESADQKVEEEEAAEQSAAEAPANKKADTEVDEQQAEEQAAQKRNDEEAAAARAPGAPIQGSDAHRFCEEYAIAQFPYGVNFHRITQTFADEKTDTGWYYKLGADITNQFGAKQKGMNIECHMSGTNEAPAMDDFLAY